MRFLHVEIQEEKVGLAYAFLREYDAAMVWSGFSVRNADGQTKHGINPLKATTFRDIQYVMSRSESSGGDRYLFAMLSGDWDIACDLALRFGTSIVQRSDYSW